MLDFNHHAHLLRGDRERLTVALERLIKQLISEARLHPADVVWQRVKVFGIDDSRRLAVAERRRAIITNGLKFFIILAESLTIPAQQALLKTFEEPTLGTHLCLLTPLANNLLPTLRSRCQIVSSNNEQKELLTETDSLARQFLEAGRVKRLELVRSLTVSTLLNLIDELINGVRKDLGRSPDRAFGERLDQLLRLRAYLGGSGAQPRLVGEHLALVFPEVKVV